ncbi:hypothetical protein ScPMuIL_009094 [Solemya velum]
MEAKLTSMWFFLSLFMIGGSISHLKVILERCLDNRHKCDGKCIGRSGRAFVMCVMVCRVRFELCIRWYG